MAGSSFLSQTLQSITTTKMQEQDKRRKTFETRKAKLVESAEASADDRTKLAILLSGFRDLSSSNKGVWYVDEDRKNLVQNVGRYLEQSSRDPSMSSAVLRQFERDMHQKLGQESQRFSFADLYYRLLSEWTDAKSAPIVESERKEEDLDGSFEYIQKYTLQNLKDKFSSVVFTPLETDEVKIDAYLSSLFDDDYATELLDSMRKQIADFGLHLKQRATPFDRETLRSCIKALLTNDLLNDDAKMTLSEFSTNEDVLDEIADGKYFARCNFNNPVNSPFSAESPLFRPRQLVLGGR